ncbi:MAG TPA: hypothetical protein VEB21_06885, partial [Terriglobales bacterium]|nr:hypothetical protein [Terriglobales bacterium]
VIPAAQSSFQAVQDALTEIYERVMQIDLPGISVDARNALQSADSTFDEARGVIQDARISRALDNLDRASQSINKVADNLERATHDVELKPILDNANEAMLDARKLFASLNQLGTEQIAGAAREFGLLMQTAQQIVSSLQYTIDRLDRTASSLRGLTEEVRSQPSLLLFSDPPATDVRERRGRER